MMKFVLVFFVILSKQVSSLVKGLPEVLSDISSDCNCTVIVSTSQYCFVDNSTIRIKEDDKIINIFYYCDHYVTASNQTHVILFLYNDTTELPYCTTRTDGWNITVQVLRLAAILIDVVACLLLALYLLHRKLYSILQFKLLLLADVFYLLTLALFFVYTILEFAVHVPSVVCLILFHVIRGLARCAAGLQTAMIMITCYAFYRCHKLKPKFSSSHKVKIFRMCLIGSSIYSGVITVMIVSFDLLLKYRYSTDNGYCIAFDKSFKERKVSSLIYTAFAVITIIICIVILMINITLFRLLTKRITEPVNTVATEINKKLFKLTVVLTCMVGISLLVYYTVQSIAVEHAPLSGIILFMFERIMLLYISYTIQLS